MFLFLGTTKLQKYDASAVYLNRMPFLYFSNCCRTQSSSFKKNKHMASRKDFLRNCLIGTSGILLFPQLLQAQQEPKPSQLDPAIVKDFVGKAHRDTEVETVKELLKKYPTLLNSCWDWGGGDFETALGAASHTGNLDVVNHLVENGAQLNFLTLCVLGKTDLVKTMLTAFPGLINMKGPHGFTPLHHANKGGENAKEVKALLESLGAKETKVPLVYPKQ